jgi:hypothetical protein
MTYTGFENYSMPELEREIEAGICIEFPAIAEMLKRIDNLIPISQALEENGIDPADLTKYVKAMVELEIETGTDPEAFKELLEEKDREIQNLKDGMAALEDHINELEITL